MDDFEKKPTKYYSRIQEDRVARYLNWGVVSGSGARPGQPGDLIGAHFLGECKTHTEPGHKIVFNQEVWKKLQNEAQAKFSFPVLIVDDGSQRVDKTWCLFMPFVAPEYTKFKDYDIPIRTNAIFDGDEALKKYAEDFYDEHLEIFGTFVIKLGNENLCMCPLPEFNRIFGDH